LNLDYFLRGERSVLSSGWLENLIFTPNSCIPINIDYFIGNLKWVN
jgi:hypothetical protein